MDQVPELTSISRYGITWNVTHEVEIELQLVAAGGKINRGFDTFGYGMAYHVRKAQEILWPEKKWHRWNELMNEEFCRNKITGVMGPANSAKTHEAATHGLILYFANPDNSSILISSTDSRSLELRIFGEVKKYWNRARQIWPGTPGRLVESKQTIVTEVEDEDDARDFRNGIIGIPCMVGGTYVGLGKYVGIKNKHLILIADEAQFMSRAFFDAISNLNKNQGFKAVVLGNPKDPMDCLGLITEPATHLGGWDGIDQGKKTQVWDCRMPGARTVQLVGTDSPNFDVGKGEIEPFPFLIGRRAIEDDLAYYGPDSLQFTMMNLGVMPKSAWERRVIHRHLVEINDGFKRTTWLNNSQIHLVGLDIAYGGTGGDRSILCHMAFGLEVGGKQVLQLEEPPITVPSKPGRGTTSEEVQALYVKAFCEKNSIAPERVFFDSTGRATFASAIARVWSPATNAIEFGGSPTDKHFERGRTAREMFKKRVTEIWWATRFAIEAKQIRGMTEEVVAEGSMREWTMVEGNKIDVEPKEKTKKRMGRSPDIYDAFAVAVEGARQLGFVIHKLVSAAGLKKSSEWMDKMIAQRQKLMASKTLIR